MKFLFFKEKDMSELYFKCYLHTVFYILYFTYCICYYLIYSSTSSLIVFSEPLRVLSVFFIILKFSPLSFYLPLFIIHYFWKLKPFVVFGIGIHFYIVTKFTPSVCNSPITYGVISLINGTALKPISIGSGNLIGRQFPYKSVNLPMIALFLLGPDLLLAVQYFPRGVGWDVHEGGWRLGREFQYNVRADYKNVCWSWLPVIYYRYTCWNN